jgi:uncharacterized protein RhaS with RHS repeats
MKTTKLIIIALFVLVTAQVASAYYCPATGRWLSRDPIGEPGFENLRAAGVVPRAGQVISPASLPPGRWINRDPIETERQPNRYAFVANNSISYIDTLGLSGCICGVKSLKAISDGWKVNPNSIVFTFHVEAKFRKDAGYAPSCCKVVQWIQDNATRNGQLPPVDGNPPRDGNLHIDNNLYNGDDVTDSATGMGGYNTSSADDTFTYTDTPTRNANNGDVLAGDKRFRIVIYDSCNGFKKVSSAQFGIYTHGTWPSVDYGVE